MAVSEGYKEYVVDQLGKLGYVTVKKMFGGAGIYVMAGMKPFKPFDDKPTVMPYYEVPVDVLENREQLAEWAMKALNASRNNHTKPKKRKLAKEEGVL